MPSRVAKPENGVIGTAAGRFGLAWLAAVCVVLGASGCEYFTSHSLEKLKPSATKPIVSAAEAEADALSHIQKLPPPDAPALGPSLKLTAADLVTLLERVLRGNRQELGELEPQLQDYDEDDRARSTFQKLDDMLQDLERRRKTVAADAKQAEDLAQRIAALRTPWELARERLNLDLRGRMLSLERINLLNSILAHDQQRLNAILESGDALKALEETKAPAPTPTPTPVPLAADGKAAVTPPAVVEPPKAAAEEPKPAAPAPAPVSVPSLLPGVPKPEEKKADAAKTDAAKTAETVPAKDEVKEAKLPPSKELIAAKREFAAKSTVVQKLQERTMTLDARMQNVARSIELVGELAEVSRLCMENATRTRAYLQEEMQRDPKSPALEAWTTPGVDVITALDRRILACREEAKNRLARHDAMVEERDLIFGALKSVTERTQSAEEGLKKVQEQVEALESPFSSYHIMGWLWFHGPSILATLVVMALLYWIVSRYAHKIVQIFATRGLRGSKAERDNRMDTLVSVLQNTGSVVILVGGAMTICSQAGVPVTPLLGGAAVAGVAVAFGAQNLIKDFFYGFMILFENQYKLKDVVRIGDHTGQVEQITLRMTALRDDEGALHFMPNGSTTSVVNMTHGWSRAAFAIRIALAEDVDRVIAAIQELGKEIRQDPALRLMIVDDLTMLGVDEITETVVVIKFYIKTLPLQQWNVKREFLRRLKKKFDQLKVIPPPPPTPAPAPAKK
ncbi:mechanosensitive ion channel family protein [Paludisphaera borealis]|uniref:Putative MscS family protein YkuT n=1 Tax=Paludisphaera borealis TaxID=1387353 RepID=A0A1U7CQY4_9BACT|nr:mechanosensitive ion channel family protein [Paludisphaera borealis]APW61342.1 putative MscS family protein YkuT [Paludisphaera borealis]